MLVLRSAIWHFMVIKDGSILTLLRLVRGGAESTRAVKMLYAAQKLLAQMP